VIAAPPTAAGRQVDGRQFIGWPVSLPSFAGPLDLLLYLVDREQVSIYDIPIAQITSQYLQYLHLVEDLQPERAGEFLVMAATLLEIKARMLLPRPPAPAPDQEPEDPRAALVQQLLEYRRFKEAASSLQERLQLAQALFTRPVPLADPGTALADEVSAYDLYAALQSVFARAEQGPPAPITRPPLTLKLKMAQLLARLTRAGSEGIVFGQLFELPLWRLEVVVTFLALLELVRLGRARVRQRKLFGEIIFIGSAS